MTGSRELVRVPFCGASMDVALIEAIRKVGARRICDNLGVDYSVQLKKLKSAHWATVARITTVAEDGEARELAMLDIRSLPRPVALPKRFGTMSPSPATGAGRPGGTARDGHRDRPRGSPGVRRV